MTTVKSVFPLALMFFSFGAPAFASHDTPEGARTEQAAEEKASAKTSWTPFCTAGTLSSVKYNDNDTMTVKIGSLSLYTNRSRLEPLLFSAYVLNSPVTIFTTTCYSGGGFAETIFR